MAGGVIFWLLVVITLFNRGCAQGYKITWGKVAGWSALAVGGFADGAVEGYEFDDRQSFVRKWNVDPNGFWGPESWRLAYKNGNPDDGHRNLFTKVYGAPDFYHVADDVRKFGYITGSISIGISGEKKNGKWWHYAIDLGVSIIVSSSAKRMGMAWVRS